MEIRPYTAPAENTPRASHSSENKIFTLDHSPQGSAEPAPCLPLPLALLSLSPLFQSRHAVPPTHQAHSCLRGFVHALLSARNALPWLCPQWISPAPTSPSLTFYPKVSLSVIPSQHPVFILNMTLIHYQTLIIYLLDYCLLAPWGRGFSFCLFCSLLYPLHRARYIVHAQESFIRWIRDNIVRWLGVQDLEAVNFPIMALPFTACMILGKSLPL